MKPLRCLVVDDESLARRLLISYLEEYPFIDVIAEASDGAEAKTKIIELEPDLVFLDVEMPEMSGIQVVKSIQAEMMPMVVFSTAYERYALDAFDVHAIDYILKPIDDERLSIALKRAQEHHLSTVDKEPNKERLLKAISTIPYKSQRDNPNAPQPAASGAPMQNRVAIKDGTKTIFVELNDIGWVDAAGDYMCIHVSGETHIIRSTMKDLITKLDSDIFKRIHRSTLVNIQRIKQIKPHTKGEFFLDLDCGETIKVSRNYRSVILDFLAEQ